MKNHIGKIEEINQVNALVYLIKFSSQTLKNIEPGEYVSILCEGLTLRRPFSVADFDKGIVSVLFKKRGAGTEYISGLKIGDKIEFSAPLGNTFKLENKKTLLIGAGIGVAPLFYLKKKLEELGAQTYFAAGFLGENDIITPHPQPLSRKGRGEAKLAPQAQVESNKLDKHYNFISTDDGSTENKGSICDYLKLLIAGVKPEKIVSCAPHPVLKLIAQEAAKNGIECEVAMEKVMACGIGVCRGCVIQVEKEGRIVNKTVCKDGPVFDAAEVVW